MSYATYRISRGSTTRRLLGLAIGLLVPLVVLLALDQGLKLHIVSPGDTLVVAVDPGPQPKIDDPPLPPPPNPGAPSDFHVDQPEIVVDGESTVGAITPSSADMQASFRSSNALPIYPQSSTKNCEQGSVALNLHIGADGQMLDASVATSSGYPALDQSALRAAQRWRYTPARLQGKPVESTITQTVKFDLRNEIGISMTEREVRACLAGH